MTTNQTTVYGNGTTIYLYNSTSVLAEPSEASKTFSSQALTTVSTLVVAIASFYFGSKAVETARKSNIKDTPSKIVTNPSGSAEVVKGSSLTVEVNNTVDEWKIYGDSKGELVMGKSKIFKYTPSDVAQKLVMLSFEVSDYQNMKGLLEVKVREKPKAKPDQETSTDEKPKKKQPSP